MNGHVDTVRILLQVHAQYVVDELIMGRRLYFIPLRSITSKSSPSLTHFEQIWMSSASIRELLYLLQLCMEVRR